MVNRNAVLVESAGIYGRRGIAIRPRSPGRTDTVHFQEVLLPELLPLEEYTISLSSCPAERIR